MSRQGAPCSRPPDPAANPHQLLAAVSRQGAPCSRPPDPAANPHQFLHDRSEYLYLQLVMSVCVRMYVRDGNGSHMRALPDIL